MNQVVLASCNDEILVGFLDFTQESIWRTLIFFNVSLEISTVLNYVRYEFKEAESTGMSITIRHGSETNTVHDYKRYLINKEAIKGSV